MKALSLLAACAMALTTAAPALAAPQHHVKVRGRTDAAVHADIVAAASSICREDVDRHDGDLYAYCVREVTREAVAKAASHTLTAYDRAAFRAGGLQKTSY